MLAIIIFLPLISTIINFFLSQFLGRFGGWFLSIFLLGLGTIFSISLFYQICLQGVIKYYPLASWLDVGFIKADWCLLFDNLSVSLMMIVFIISTIVHIYSYEYMNNEPYLNKFISYLSFFTFFMLILITSENYLQLFVGWEGVGLASFLLINFWYNRILANKSAIKAFVLNRVGDVGLLIGLSFMQIAFGSLDYDVVFTCVPHLSGFSVNFLNYEINIIELISFCFLIGAVGKSAQIGLHGWLPDAMEGPTPVSALLHSATMVTAGVFLLLRSSPLLEYAPITLNYIVAFGCFTTVFAGFLGMFQYDIKKIIAYSTCSQLGYMVLSCGLSLYYVSMFHLLNHAFFKALLFLAAGSIIHGLAGEQDIRKMGGLLNIFPISYSFLLVGSLSLMGLPFLSGFYSKDPIIEFSISEYTISGNFSLIFAIISAFCTAFYSFRLLRLVFYVKPNGFKVNYLNAHEPSFELTQVPLTVLFLGSIFFGYFMKDMMIGLGSDFWKHTLYINPEHSQYYKDFEFNSSILTIRYSVLFATLFGAFLGGNFYQNFIPMNQTNLQIKHYLLNTLPMLVRIKDFFHDLGHFDKIYANLIGYPTFKLGLTFYKLLDKGLTEIFGPFGIAKLYLEPRKDIITNNNINLQILIMLSGVLFLYIIMLFI